MSDMRYTDDHEWALVDTDGDVLVGITNFAQDQLGEVVFVELPEVGAGLQRGDEAAVVESVKAAGEVKSPVSGDVTAVNDALADNPGIVNESPEAQGWFYKVKASDVSELDALMDAGAYQDFVKSLS